MALTNEDRIRALEDKIDSIKYSKAVRRYRAIMYGTLIVGFTTVAVSLGFISDAVGTFRDDCMTELMYIHQDINELAVNGCIIEEHYEAPIKTAEQQTERDLIERVVAAEARGESYEGMLAVAQTIKDRGDLWGKSYTEVVTAPAQFADPYQGEVSATVKQAVSDVFDYGFRAFEEPVTHFHNGSVSPSWASAHTFRGQIGSHYFYG